MKRARAGFVSPQGKPGVAFIINVTDPAVAYEMLG